MSAPVIVALVLLGVVLVRTPVAAQHTPGSPYREQQFSEIRGLSGEEIDDLRAGRGMGLARAAELNGYPGPRHVLDAVEARELDLSAAQLGAVRELFERMSDEARRLGDRILHEEQELEARFRQATIDETQLHRRVERIAGLRGELRLVHLRTHLATRALLSEEQIRRYNQVRGYSTQGHGGQKH